MASKRQRDDAQIEARSEEGEELKRQKSYNQILSLLDEEEEEPMEDLSSIITTLQQEISSSDPDTDQNNQQNAQPSATALQDYTDNNFSSSSSSSSSSSMKEEEEEPDRVMRHLLEASDDELGIPNGEFLVDEGALSLCDALWELEDEAANYYTLFQSHLFM